MTVPSEVSSVDHDTDGITTAFPVPFYFLANDHLVVALFDVATETSETLTLGSAYTVSGAGNASGGVVTTLATYPAGKQLRIRRRVPITQETAYQRNDPFPERAHERTLDKLTMICQQLGAFLGFPPGTARRALMLGDNDVDGTGAYRANGNRIQDLGDPVDMNDAVNKQYVVETLADLATDGSGQFVTERLADTTDEDNGAGMVGYRPNINIRRALDSRKSLISYYGCKGDGLSDDSSRIEEACLDAASRNGSFVVDDAEFVCERQLVVSGDNPFGFLGEGTAAFSFVNPDSCGIDIQMPYAGSERSLVKALGAPSIGGFKVLKLHTENVYSGKAIRIMQVGDPIGVESVRPGLWMTVRDIDMRTHPSISTDVAQQAAWLNGLEVGRLSLESGDPGGGAVIHGYNLTFQGPIPPDPSSQPYGGSGLILNTATGSKFWGNHIVRAGIGIEVTGLTEGPQILMSNIVACDYGIVAGPSQEPHLDISHCHFNTFSGAIKATNRNSGIISKCLVYQRPGSATTEYADISLTGGSSWVIEGVICGASSLSNTPSNTVRFLDIQGTAIVSIMGNIVRNRSHYARVQGNSRYVRDFGANDYSGIAVAVEDTSTGATDGSNNFVSMRGAAGAHLLVWSNGMSIPNDSDTTVNFVNSEPYNSGGSLVIGTHEMLVPNNINRVRITANIQFGSSDVGIRRVEILKNGASISPQPLVELQDGASGASINLTSFPIPAATGDRFTVSVRQTSGGPLGLLSGSWACMEIVF